MHNNTANLIDEIFGEPEIKHRLEVFKKSSTKKDILTQKLSFQDLDLMTQIFLEDDL